VSEPEKRDGRKRRIGVYVCRCGGNISDYVDVQRVVDAVSGEADVVVARQAMFTCSGTTQAEIEADITGQHLDGLVVASCSPKLHELTFRGVAQRAGLNPYQYTQVNIREQCSWTHTDDPEGATGKAIGLVRAGIARTRLTEPLRPLPVRTTPRVLVVGGGVAGMRAAIGLAGIGLGVVLVERESRLGGQAGELGEMFPHGTDGRALAARLAGQVSREPAITVFTGAAVTAKSGTFGNYRVTVTAGDERHEVDAGQIIVATGSASYQPEAGEYGYGIDGVLTLPEFRTLLDRTAGPLTWAGRPVRSIAYIYCVGNRTAARPYCSRFCCTAAVHCSLLAARHGPVPPEWGIRQYHLYRDLRTYGQNEELLTESRERGSVYLKFGGDDPPGVARNGDGLVVTVRDQLSAGEELLIPADLVVLVTGAVPRRNDDLIGALKLPVGRDGFFSEIHPKLRPVETVVDGVTIAGACQGPKTIAESAASGLAAAAHAAAVLKRGIAELDPQIAFVHPEACTGCGVCVSQCPFGAISMAGDDGEIPGDGGRPAAVIDPAACKGCGGCVPSCPAGAIDLKGYTDAQVRAMIDGLLEAP
jgi:heterodisulfide reductase subunit A2